MKKMLVVALALVAYAGHANAIPEGKDRAREAREKAMLEQRKGADAFAHGAAAQPNKALLDKVSASKAGTALNGNESHALNKAVSDPLLQKGAVSALATERLANQKRAAAKSKEEVEHADALQQLAGLRLRGIAKLADVPADVRNLSKAPGAMDFEAQAQQAFTALILSAGKEAMNYPEATTKNVVTVTEVAMKALDSNKSYAEAMSLALKELKRITKNDKLTLEDLKKLCKV